MKRPRGSRVAPVAVVVLAGGLVALAAANCASPTQIIVDVRTDTSLCAKIHAGIAVTGPDTIDKASLATYQDGCRAIQGDQGQVGALTITPSGSDDAEIGIRVVAAVGPGANPDACGRTDIDGKANWTNCILARRTTRFAPGETVTITVRLTTDCVGQYCGDDRECNAGVCVRPEQVQDDGGTSVLDAEMVDFGDTGRDASVDAGEDACTRYCVGPGATCNGNTCSIDCDGTHCDRTVSCGGSFDCAIRCGSEHACDGVTCTTSGTCSFDCTGTGSAHCTDIACRGTSCTVACSNTKDTCSAVYLDAGTNVVTCMPTSMSNPTCNDLHCTGGVCTRTCAAGGLGCRLGDQSTCVGDCEGWEDAGDGG